MNRIKDKFIKSRKIRVHQTILKYLLNIIFWLFLNTNYLNHKIIHSTKFKTNLIQNKWIYFHVCFIYFLHQCLFRLFLTSTFIHLFFKFCFQQFRHHRQLYVFDLHFSSMFQLNSVSISFSSKKKKKEKMKMKKKNLYIYSCHHLSHAFEFWNDIKREFVFSFSFIRINEMMKKKKKWKWRKKIYNINNHQSL